MAIDLLDGLNQLANLGAGMFGLDRNKRAYDLSLYNQTTNQINKYESKELSDLEASYSKSIDNLNEKENRIRNKYNDELSLYNQASLTIDNNLDNYNKVVSNIQSNMNEDIDRVNKSRQHNLDLYNSKKNLINQNANIMRNNNEVNYEQNSQRLF